MRADPEMPIEQGSLAPTGLGRRTSNSRGPSGLSPYFLTVVHMPVRPSMLLTACTQTHLGPMSSATRFDTVVIRNLVHIY